MFQTLMLLLTSSFCLLLRVWWTDIQLHAVEKDSLNISFKVRGSDVGKLTGYFIVLNQDCPFQECGSRSYTPPLVYVAQIIIAISLSPCRNHSGIKVYFHARPCRHCQHDPYYFIHRLSWTNTSKYHFCCICVTYHDCYQNLQPILFVWSPRR